MTAVIRPRRTVGLEINPSSRNRKSGNDRRIGSAAEDDEPHSVEGLPVQDAASVDDDLPAHSLEIRADEFAPLGPVVVHDAEVRRFQGGREVVRDLNARHRGMARDSRMSSEPPLNERPRIATRLPRREPKAVSARRTARSGWASL